MRVKYFAIRFDGKWDAVVKAGDGPACNADNVFIPCRCSFTRLAGAFPRTSEQALVRCLGKFPARAWLQSSRGDSGKAQERQIEASSGSPKIQLPHAYSNRFTRATPEQITSDCGDFKVEWFERILKKQPQSGKKVGQASACALLGTDCSSHHGGMYTHTGSHGEEPFLLFALPAVRQPAQRNRTGCGRKYPVRSSDRVLRDLQILGQHIPRSKRDDAKRHR